MLDVISQATQALVAAQNSSDPQMAVVYLAAAKNALTEAQEQCRKLSVVIAMREKEIVRLSKKTKELAP